jgi:hypothetical protein
MEVKVYEYALCALVRGHLPTPPRCQMHARVPQRHPLLAWDRRIFADHVIGFSLC